ncbi:archaemetzincin-2 isoform X2 [Mixophyes fleayi]|uniref:archaemetzincin-2 isoform X2 n=1 Tax=Mixophyes fleayi TaxID=3061075 RepID=UPI003F4D7995
MMQVLRHTSDTLRHALTSEDPMLLELYEQYSPAERKMLSEAFRPDSALFRPVTIHSPSDWIPSHSEPTETFQEFYQKPNRHIPTVKRKSIYVQTIGDLLRYLKTIKPADAFCIVGATMIDLYPRDSWNFVFGTASLTEGMGVFSFARYDEDFYSPSYKGRIKGRRPAQGDYSVFNGYYTPLITDSLLLRSCKTLTHEIGHMFGLRHCQWLHCVMQGSNHLEESDRRPLDLCPICLRKLQSAIGFNIAERYNSLLQWIEEEESNSDAGTSGENQHRISKPVDRFQEHRTWIKKCLDLLT